MDLSEFLSYYRGERGKEEEKRMREFAEKIKSVKKCIVPIEWTCFYCMKKWAFGNFTVPFTEKEVFWREMKAAVFDEFKDKLKTNDEIYCPSCGYLYSNYNVWVTVALSFDPEKIKIIE